MAVVGRLNTQGQVICRGPDVLRREMTDAKSTTAQRASDRLTRGHKAEEITGEFQEVLTLSLST